MIEIGLKRRWMNRREGEELIYGKVGNRLF